MILSSVCVFLLFYPTYICDCTCVTLTSWRSVMCYPNKVDIACTPSLTRDYLYRLRPSGHSHFRLNNTAWRAACEAGVALQRPTHRGYRGGARKQRPIRVIVSARPIAPAKSVPRVRHLTSISTRTITPSLKVVLLNTRSLCNKVSVVSEMLLDAAADITFFTETWLRDEHQDIVNDLTQPGFEFKKLNRSQKRGGGLGVSAQKFTELGCAQICSDTDTFRGFTTVV